MQEKGQTEQNISYVLR